MSTATPGDHAPAGNGEEHATDPAMERAEELVDQLGERVGYFASLAGLQIRKAFARAREEVEDIWAEAQHLRQQGRAH